MYLVFLSVSSFSKSQFDFRTSSKLFEEFDVCLPIHVTFGLRSGTPFTSSGIVSSH